MPRANRSASCETEYDRVLLTDSLLLVRDESSLGDRTVGRDVMGIDAAECSPVELPLIGQLLAGGAHKRRLSTGPSVIPAYVFRLEITREAS
jgi:hypothetical protein